MQHISPVEELKVHVEPMKGYNLDFGFLSFQSRNHVIEWNCGQVLPLRTPQGTNVVAVLQVVHQECRRNAQGSPTREEMCTKDCSCIRDIEIL